MQNNSIAILESATEKTRNNDSLFRYRQCSNFYYLTGYNSPNATLFIVKENNKLRKPSYILTIDFGKNIGFKKRKTD